METSDYPARPNTAKRSVAALDPRLTDAIARRDDLVLRWVEALAHGGPGADILTELIEVEDTIAGGWPRIWLQHSNSWFQRDATLIHTDDGDPVLACPTCRARAAATEEPEVA